MVDKLAMPSTLAKETRSTTAVTRKEIFWVIFTLRKSKRFLQKKQDKPQKRTGRSDFGFTGADTGAVTRSGGNDLAGDSRADVFHLGGIIHAETVLFFLSVKSLSVDAKDMRGALFFSAGTP